MWCAAAFFAVTALAGLPMGAVSYAALLSGAGLLVLLAVDMARFYTHLKALKRLEAMDGLDTLPLPVSRDPMLQAYQALALRLHTDMRRLMDAFDAREQDAMDYYTLWMHQIKTPIAAMRLMLDPDNRPMQNELFRVEQYVEMALEYLRLSGNGTDLVFAPVKVDEVIRSQLRKYADLFILSKLSLDYEETDLVAVTDGKWLGFIIGQLLSNAVKYTPKGGRVTIRVANERFSLSDTGIGIAPEDLPRVFDKGYTGFNGRLQSKSSGIGLYLCKRAADMLSHKISIASTAGKGTCVTLDLKRYNLTDL